MTSAERPTGPAAPEPVHRLRRLIAFALLLALGLLCLARGTAVVRSDDTWMHLSAGREVARLGALPRRDLLLNADPSPPWILHSWLAEVAFYQVHRAGGLPALMLLRAALVLATMLAAAALFRRLGSPTWLAALLAALLLQAPGLRAVLLRPLLFTHLLLVGYLWTVLAVHRGRWSPRRLWLLAPAMILWANLHAGHLVGAAVALSPLLWALPRGLGAARPRSGPDLRQVLPPVLATVAATLVTPYGPRTWAYAAGHLPAGQFGGQVWEWVSFSPGQEPLLAGLLLLGALALLWRLRRLDPLLLLLAAGLLASPLLASRFMFHGALGAGLALAAAAGAGPRAGAPARPLGRALGVLAAGLCLLLLLGAGVHAVVRGRGFRFEVDQGFFPVAAAAFMERHALDGKLLNYREWGGYLGWHRPGRRVFIDGRVAVSAGSIIRDYVAVAEARPGFGNMLNKLGIQLVVAPYKVLRPAPDAPVQLVALDPAWSLIYFDDTALIYLRNSPANAPLVRRLGYRGLLPSSRRAPFRPGAPLPLLMAECRRALATAPSERAATYLGVLLMNQGHLERARGPLEQALRLSPASAAAHNNLGVLYRRLGRRERAKGLFRRALELDPAHRSARKNLQELSANTL